MQRVDCGPHPSWWQTAVFSSLEPQARYGSKPRLIPKLQRQENARRFRRWIRPERAVPKPLRYAIDSTVLRKLRRDAMILHPLPRTVELDKNVDDDPRAMYFRQAANGLYVRMALLSMLLDGE